MASLLYRLGRLAARRAWIVIAGWFAALVVAASAFLAFGGTLASSFTIPGTETERVTDQLAAELPELAGASATVVFTTADGTPFTADQREGVAAVLEHVAGIDGVAGTVDPFVTAAQREAQAAQLVDARTQADAAATQLADALAELDAGQARLDDAVAQARAGGYYDAAAEQFAAQQAQLDAGREQYAAGTKELAVQEAMLADAEALQRAASGLATVSDDGAAAIGVVSFAEDGFSLSAELKQRVADALDEAGIPGVDVSYSSTIAMQIGGLLGVGEVVGLVLAAIVLLVMLRAALPAVVPLITSVTGVGVGVAGALAFSDVVDMDSVTPMLGIMLGLAVGIDYSLFILHRHRRQLAAGADLHESIGLANGTAGNAVVFAGSTVVVALVALAVTGIPFLTVMGVVGAATVLCAVAVSVSLTPALLALAGARVLPRRMRAAIGAPAHAPRPVVPLRHGVAVAMGLAGTVLLAVLAIPALSMRLALPDGSQEEVDSPQYRSFAAISESFSPGEAGPLLVVVESPAAVAEAAQLGFQADVATVLAGHDDVVAVAPVGVSADGTVFAFQVIPGEGPASESTAVLVNELRDLSPLPGGLELGVAGHASGSIDVSGKLADALPVYLAVVVGLSLVILVVVFRSILVPVVATGGFVLTLFAAFGAVTAIYQWGWLADLFGVHDPGPVLSFAPILVMGVLFGLAMDYQLFLVSGMREAYVHGLPARHAVVVGLRGGRAVVTAAAIIMASVFGGFVFSHLAMVRPIGFGLAIGVLLDAFVVRMMLVPSALHLLGEKAWWLPAWLDKVLPQADVEGAALERTHPLHGIAAPEPEPTRA